MRAAQRLYGASSIASRNFFDQAVPAKEAGRGLVPPASASVMMGQGGGNLRDHLTPVPLAHPHTKPDPDLTLT